MRSDRDLGLKKEDGELLHLTGQRVQGNPNTSLSGHESNHLYLNGHGEHFAELSSLSGLDHSGDSRAFAVLDYDRDGLLDIALVNANAPLFQLFENQLGELSTTSATHYVALRLIGGNQTSTASSGWSAQDAIGARVELQLEEFTLTREYSAGRGLAAQNSSTLLIGIGESSRVHSATIRWPSGRTTELGQLRAGALITVYEDAEQSPTGSASVSTTYELDLRAPIQSPSIALPTPRFQPEPVASKGTRPELRVYTAMATWCASCKRELPQVERLTGAFAAVDIEFYGVGIDVAETPDQLTAYNEKWKPAYELLTGLSDQTRTDFKEFLATTLASEALPSSVITAADGRVVRTMFGIPTVSELRELQNAMRAD